jgi:hypothetical protein
MVDVLLRPRSHRVSWVISRIRSRTQQRSVIRFWNRWGILPEGVERMERYTPAVRVFWERQVV